MGYRQCYGEFLYADDMGQASRFILELNKQTYQDNTQPMLAHINVGTGKDVTIKEMLETMKKVVGYKGKFTFDTTKPDGPPRKLVDSSRIRSMGFDECILDLEESLYRTYQWFLNNIN